MLTSAASRAGRSQRVATRRGGSGGLSAIDRRNQLLAMADLAKALAGYRRYLDIAAFGFKASSDADASSTTGSVDTSAGAWKPSVIAGANQIPLMTAATTSGVTISASSYLAPYEGWRAGDRSVAAEANTWITAAASPTGWLRVDFGSGNAKVITSYTIQAYINGVANRRPTSWTFRGSNDAAAWTTLDTKSGYSWPATDNPIGTFPIVNSTAYRYYEVTVSANNGSTDYVQITDITLLTADVTSNSTLITPYQTADTARTKARAIFEIDPVDAITLGTDWTAEVTCNGGASWHAAATYTNCGKGQGSRTVIETDKVTCTGGTSFAARVKNQNNKMVHVYKAAVEAFA